MKCPLPQQRGHLLSWRVQQGDTKQAVFSPAGLETIGGMAHWRMSELAQGLVLCLQNSGDTTSLLSCYCLPSSAVSWPPHCVQLCRVDILSGLNIFDYEVYNTVTVSTLRHVGGWFCL